ncbi:MAG TPA: hypothetical protein VIM12_02945 [Noviherbaspirillum sp.]|jgi:uncharacterized protein (DUF3084 family)|uniref:hypothetical protein n=1 Tax=Noviherbaspirillum sp. TaxID=1926288 RepID=UPI002F93BD74
MHWDLSDFAVAAVLLASTFVLYRMLAMFIVRPRYRAVLVAVLAAALCLAWAELAVGVFGTPFSGT